MGTEIERKFLVTSDAWRPGYDLRAIRQGYLAFGPPVSVRIRVSGEQAHLNIKRSTLEISRVEFEYPIPLAEAEFMLAFRAGHGGFRRNQQTFCTHPLIHSLRSGQIMAVPPRAARRRRSAPNPAD